jgi:hypothetical protein
MVGSPRFGAALGPELPQTMRAEILDTGLAAPALEPIAAPGGKSEREPAAGSCAA